MRDWIEDANKSSFFVDFYRVKLAVWSLIFREIYYIYLIYNIRGGLEDSGKFNYLEYVVNPDCRLHTNVRITF